MLMVRKSAWLCFVMGLVFLFQQTSRSAESNDPHEMLEYLIAGLQAERQRLRQGVFRIHGVRIREDPAPVGKLEGPVQMLGAFDFDKGCYRFDREELSWIVVGKESALLDRRVCRTPELSIHYNSEFRRLEIHPPDTVDPGTLSGTGGYLDVRCMGLYNFGQLFKSLELDAVCQRLLAIPLEMTCAEEGDGIFRLDWTFQGDKPKYEKRTTRWIDTNKGFTPIRLETRIRSLDLGETEWRAPFQAHEITWTQIADLWVPSSYRVFLQFALPSKKPSDPSDHKPTPRYRKFTYRYTFDWESVNEPVDGAYFDYERFDLPDGTYIADARGGELRVLQVVGDPVTVRNLSEPPTSSWHRIFFVMLNVLFIFFIVALLWWRVHRKPCA